MRTRHTTRKSRARITESRLRAGFILVTMVISVFAARLFVLQGIDANDYAALARREGGRAIELPATRGAIVDRRGELLATSMDGAMVVANPKVTAPRAGEIATLVSRELEIDYFKAFDALTKPDSQFAYLARRVPMKAAETLMKKLRASDLDGVSTARDPVRYYPSDDVAANVIGFMGADNKPLAGVERTQQSRLAGRDGSATYETGADGQRLPLGETYTDAPRDGKRVRLTIDRDVQWYTQRVLESTTIRSRGATASATVLDVRTGQVLALADYPTFDANAPTEARGEDLGTRSLSDVFEPGSVQKVLTAAALLDAGRVTPRTRITVPSRLPRQDRVIGDYWEHGRLRLTLAGAIAKSSNIGTVLAADQMSAQSLGDYLRRFGLGQRTEVGLTGEAGGLLAAPDKWAPINKATISFGQGLSVNVLQMAAAVNTIANGGVYLRPQLVLGSGPESRATGERRVVSERTAKTVSRIMEGVVDPGQGTAPLAAIPGYRVAGKTGTAQRANDRCGCYDGTLTVSFAGFAPADAPRFLVYVVVHNPRAGGGGGTVAAPAFRRIMTFLLQRFAVPPTGATERPYPSFW